MKCCQICRPVYTILNTCGQFTMLSGKDSAPSWESLSCLVTSQATNKLKISSLNFSKFWKFLLSFPNLQYRISTTLVQKYSFSLISAVVMFTIRSALKRIYPTSYRYCQSAYYCCLRRRTDNRSLRNISYCLFKNRIMFDIFVCSKQFPISWLAAVCSEPIKKLIA